MPRYRQSSINRQEQVSTPGLTQNVQVVARPVDTSITAVQDNSAEAHYRQLAYGLDAFAGGLGHLSNSLVDIAMRRRAEEEMKLREQERLTRMEDMARGENDARNLATSTTDPVLFNQALSKESTPAYQEAYRKSLGHHIGRQASLTFQEDFTRDFKMEGSTPEAAQKWATEYFQKKVEGISDPIVLNSFADTTANAVVHAVTQTQSHSVKSLNEQKADMFSGDVGEYLGNEGRPSDWLNRLKVKHANDMRPIEVENEAFKRAADYAISTGNPKVLEAFEQENPDGTPSFSKRFPEMMVAAKQRAEAAFLQQHQGEVKELSMQIVKDYESNLRVIKDNPLEASDEDLQSLESRLDQSRQSGVISDEKWNSLTNKVSDIRYNRQQLINHLPELDQGGYTSLSLPESDKEALFEFKVKGRSALIGDDSPENMERVRMELALSNSIVAPKHVKQITSGYRLGLPKGAKPEDVPAQMVDAAKTALTYLQLDPQGFMHSIKDKQAQDYYLSLATYMEHNEDGSLVNGILNAKNLEQSEVKIDSIKPLIRDNVEKAVNSLDDSDDAEKSAAARQWMTEEAELSAKRGLAVPDSDVLAKKFQAFHTQINGQYVDTRPLGRPINEDEAEQMGEALNEYGKRQLLTTGLAKAYNLTADEINEADVKIFPSPYSKKGDESEYNMLINGKILIPGGVNLTALKSQYLNKDHYVAYAQQVDDIDALIKQAEDTGMVSPKDAAQALTVLQVGKKAGAISSSTYREYNKKLSKASSKAEEAAKKTAAEMKQQVIATNEIVKPFVKDDPGKLLVAAKLPRTVDPDVGSLPDTIMMQSKAGQYRPALAMAIFGATTKKLPDGVPNQIGIGYDLDQDAKTVKADLKKAGFPFELQSLKDVKTKLSADMPEKLLNASLDRHIPMVQEILTPHVYDALADNQKAAFEVLALCSGNKAMFKEALNHIQSGSNYEAARYLTKVPPARRVSALAYIRAMANNPVSFGNLIRREPR